MDRRIDWSAGADACTGGPLTVQAPSVVPRPIEGLLLHHGVGRQLFQRVQTPHVSPSFELCGEDRRRHRGQRKTAEGTTRGDQNITTCGTSHDERDFTDAALIHVHSTDTRSADSKPFTKMNRPRPRNCDSPKRGTPRTYDTQRNRHARMKNAQVTMSNELIGERS